MKKYKISWRCREHKHTGSVIRNAETMEEALSKVLTQYGWEDCNPVGTQHYVENVKRVRTRSGFFDVFIREV